MSIAETDNPIVDKYRTEVCADYVHAILDISSHLCLELLTAAHAVTYFHKYSNHLNIDSLNQDTDSEKKQIILSTMIFLAAKVREESRSMRDVINVVKTFLGFDVVEMEFDEKYSALKEAIIAEEQIVLRIIGFDTFVDLPYAYLFNFGRYLKFGKTAIRAALAFVNDALINHRFTHTSPVVIAAASILLVHGLKYHKSIKDIRLVESMKNVYGQDASRREFTSSGINVIEVQSVCSLLNIDESKVLDAMVWILNCQFDIIRYFDHLARSNS